MLNGADLTIGSTAGTGGIFDLNGFSETAGSLSGLGGTILNNSSTAATLTIGSGNRGAGSANNALNGGPATNTGLYTGVIADTNNAEHRHAGADEDRHRHHHPARREYLHRGDDAGRDGFNRQRRYSDDQRGQWLDQQLRQHRGQRQRQHPEPGLRRVTAGAVNRVGNSTGIALNVGGELKMSGATGSRCRLHGNGRQRRHQRLWHGDGRRGRHGRDHLDPQWADTRHQRTGHGPDPWFDLGGQASSVGRVDRHRRLDRGGHEHEQPVAATAARPKT